MTTVAFIGLGVMGAPMAVNLANKGFSVIGYNRSPRETAAFTESGLTLATSLSEAVRQADVVALMLPDSPDVQTVLAAADGVFANAQPHTLIVDFSSIRPDVSAELAEQAAARGLTYVDAPVSGGEPGAKAATLSIMVGATSEAFTRAKPVLDAVGATVVHVGPNGAGQTVKAANQLIVAGNLQLLAEALVFLDASHVDLQAAVEVLGAGLAGSAVLKLKAAAMIAGTFAPGFRIDLHHKDLGIVSHAARGVGVTVPLGALTAQLMASARSNGDGHLDHSALIRGVQRLSGRHTNPIPAPTPTPTPKDHQ